MEMKILMLKWVKITQEILNVKRKKQAELLISGDVPPDLIIGFGCYSESARNKIISIGVTEEKVKVIPNAYY